MKKLNKTGVVLSIKGKKACIMTEEGEIAKVVIKRSDPSVGEIYSAPLAKPIFSPKRMAAAAALIFAVLIAGFTYTYNVEAASVIFDGNPEIKLGVNRWNRVIKAEALNEDGREVLSSISVKNKPLNTALGAIVSEAKKKELISKDSKTDSGEKENLNILIDRDKEKVTSDLDEFKMEMKKNNLDVTIGIQKGNTENRSKQSDDSRNKGAETSSNNSNSGNSTAKQKDIQANDKTYNGDANGANKETTANSNKTSVDGKNKNNSNTKERNGENKKDKK